MKRIAVLTSGGDAPGMNAAIRAVVKKSLHEGMEVYGVNYGYAGLVEGDIRQLSHKDVNGIISTGGTFLYSARYPEFNTLESQKQALAQLKKLEIECLVVVGGDGSFRGADALHKLGFPTIGIPGTIDNDVPGTDLCIGFDTAINTVLESVDKVRDTATSHMRTFIIEVMGRQAGDIALWVGVGSEADQIIVPEIDFDMSEIAQSLHKGREKGKKHSIIILAEGVMNGNDFKEQLAHYDNYHARVTVLGHVQRGGSPSAKDRVLASSFGAKAVEVLLNGGSGKCLGISGTNILVHDIHQVLNEEKRIPDLSLYQLNKEISF